MAKRAKSGGRKAGTPNKATADVKALAQAYTELCVWRLGKVVLSKDDAAATAAIKILLAYGCGAPRAAIDVTVKPVYAISDKPLTPAEWAAKHAAVGPPARTAKRAD